MSLGDQFIATAVLCLAEPKHLLFYRAVILGHLVEIGTAPFSPSQHSVMNGFEQRALHSIKRYVPEAYKIEQGWRGRWESRTSLNHPWLWLVDHVNQCFYFGRRVDYSRLNN
jgi:hypothetical protein